ncbi:hypothetical protein E0H26_25365 [Micromonospora zingiberis]|uniref:DUF397 domain-containing protein n=1 Tax=Micromonospora zingiberis TaxID=2053011 RepID=A0A4R0G8A4_9ACTN|nr:hypothetical protein [Micromonospora zingiberis]TCB91619.1 hypothetical protein E0H26_25365 [Micromonospora zingiberis]
MSRPKPRLEDLHLDVDRIEWRAVAADTSIHLAIVDAHGERWVLMRSPDLVSVFSEHEWECFLDGAKRGEFDDLTRRTG